ncbi:hypothetical protein JYT83_00375 [bacterium AH-315-F18]|nr:hypothetical protein [bacterium AH-315-F18]
MVRLGLLATLALVFGCSGSATRNEPAETSIAPMSPPKEFETVLEKGVAPLNYNSVIDRIVEELAARGVFFHQRRVLIVVEEFGGDLGKLVGRQLHSTLPHSRKFKVMRMRKRPGDEREERLVLENTSDKRTRAKSGRFLEPEFIIRGEAEGPKPGRGLMSDQSRIHLEIIKASSGKVMGTIEMVIKF